MRWFYRLFKWRTTNPTRERRMESERSTPQPIVLTPPDLSLAPQEIQQVHSWLISHIEQLYSQTMELAQTPGFTQHMHNPARYAMKGYASALNVVRFTAYLEGETSEQHIDRICRGLGNRKRAWLEDPEDEESAAAGAVEDVLTSAQALHGAAESAQEQTEDGE